MYASALELQNGSDKFVTTSLKDLVCDSNETIFTLLACERLQIVLDRFSMLEYFGLVGIAQSCHLNAIKLPRECKKGELECQRPTYIGPDS